MKIIILYTLENLRHVRRTSGRQLANTSDSGADGRSELRPLVTEYVCVCYLR